MKATTPGTRPTLLVVPASSRHPRLARERGAGAGVVLVLASLGLFMAFVDVTIVNLAFPDIGRSFPEAGVAGLSWVLSGYSIVAAAFLVPVGRLADVIGRKRVYVASLVAFTVTSVLCAAAPSAEVLIGGRVLQGMSAAALVPTGFALVMAAFPVERRLEAVSISAAVGALAGGIGPSLGGMLVSWGDWRLIFLVNVPVGVAAVAVCARALPESRGEPPRAFPDVLGALLFAVSVALVVLGIVKGQDWGWTGGRVLGAFGAAIAFGWMFALRCRRHAEPLFDPTLVRIRSFAVASLSHALSMAGFFGYTLCNVLFLTSVWQYSLLETGGALTPGPIVAFVIAAGTSRLLRTVEARALLLPGGLLWAAAIAWLALHAGARPDFLGLWLPTMIVAGIGAGLVISHGASAAINAAPGDRFGTACGLQQVGRAIGAAVGIAGAAAVIGAPSAADALGPYQRAWIVGAASLAAAGIASLWIGRKRPTTSAAPHASAMGPRMGAGAR
jgi:NTE family protein